MVACFHFIGPGEPGAGPLRAAGAVPGQLHPLVVHVLHGQPQGVGAVPGHAAGAHRAGEVEDRDVVPGELLGGARAAARLAQPRRHDLVLERLQGCGDVSLTLWMGSLQLGTLQNTFVQKLALLNVANPVSGLFYYPKNYFFLILFWNFTPSSRFGFCKF